VVLRRLARVRHRDRRPQGHRLRVLPDVKRYSHHRPVETARRYAGHRCSDVRSSDVNHSMVRRDLRSAWDGEHPEVAELDGRTRSWGDPGVAESDDQSR
jgi:hypothetical protein